MKDMFTLTETAKRKLGISGTSPIGNNWIDNFKIIFDRAKEENLDSLHLNEITIGYYRLITAKYGGKIKKKRDVASAVYRYSSTHGKDPCILERVSCGRYRLKDDIDISKLSEKCSSGCSKPLIYNGKTYNSRTELALELGLHLSTISHHIKRHGYNFSTLGKNKRKGK